MSYKKGTFYFQFLYSSSISLASLCTSLSSSCMVKIAQNLKFNFQLKVLSFNINNITQMDQSIDSNYVYYIVRATNYCTKFC